MFFTVQASDYEKHETLLDQMFRLRKRIFADELQWDVDVVDGIYERDRYDAIDPVYLIWSSPDHSKLYGSMRLLPTTGPTLLYDVFRTTFPDAADLVAPGIWEATRTCVDMVAIERDHPGVDAKRAFGLVSLATAECAVTHGIHTLICNYEPHMKRVYDRIGAQVQELGRADGFGRRPVCCGAFAMAREIVDNMRLALKVDLPLYNRAAVSREVSAASEMAA
jgi:acyl homoserine lactone synthase